jgi:hypothetical protein
MKLDIDLQSWSELLTSLFNRGTTYEELTELDQVTDRLALEKLEFILGLVDEDTRSQIIANIHKGVGGNDIA